MGRIRGTDHTLLSGLVEAVQLAGAHTYVEAVGHPSVVADLAGGAEVVLVALLVLHSL